VLDTYLAIVSHPLFFTFIALCGGVYLLLSLTCLSTEKIANPAAWLRQHYVGAILLAVGGLFVGALCFYLVEIALNVPLLVDRLTVEINTSKTDKQPENLRNLAYAIATLIAVLAGSATVFFSSLRVWMNERNTRATEQGLITDRINKAVEGLGAEKTIYRLGRDLSYRFKGDGRGDKTRWGFEFKDDPVFDPESHDLIEAETGGWEPIQQQAPNLEVRIGSIFALERVARENPDFHVQVMEILCAYVRLNAPRSGKQPTAEFDKQPTMRNDILTALRVIGRRTANGKAIEVAQRHRLDLRVCDLSGADFSDGDYSGAMFHSSLIEFARFRGGLFHGTEFNDSLITFAAFEDGDFTGSQFCGVQITEPNRHSFFNRFQSAKVTGANFAGANISGVRSFGGVEKLSQTFGTSDTTLHSLFGWDKVLQSKLDDLHYSEASEDTASIQRLLAEKGLEQWSCFPRGDRAHDDHYNALMIQLDLCDFPFHGRRK